MPAPMDVTEGFGRETEPEVASTPQRVELQWYHANLVFKDGENVDMDLLNENRSLIHTGKLFQKLNTRFGWNGWIELFVLLFDNYLVMTKPEQKGGAMKYQVYRRPIPLEFLTLSAFTDPPTQWGSSLQWPLYRKNETVYPCAINHIGRSGGLYTLFAESPQARLEWKSRLEEAIGLRKAVQESNKVFDMETLSADVFSIPSPPANAGGSSYDDGHLTGKVTCSIPFNAPDGRELIAIGCAEGVWIGSRGDPRSLVRVLHLRMVTQCAVLEDYGIFIVLADNSLLAYHIDAFMPSSPETANPPRALQKLSGNKDVQFFTPGTLDGRTVVIYMKKKNLDSVFRVLEPVIGKIYGRASDQAHSPVEPRLSPGNTQSDCFRVYRDFFLPHHPYDLLFLKARKARIVIMWNGGFEVVDLTDLKSLTIPQRDDPQLKGLVKRIKSCKPIGMFRSQRDEFLLCYDEFGLYVNKHGDPVSKGVVEWEGTVERAALHAPYILLFDRRFIEIRHVETGNLVQVIHGEDMRCTWDGRGMEKLPGSRESRVHGVMNGEVPPSGPGGVVTQRVFELVPTIPLP